MEVVKDYRLVLKNEVPVYREPMEKLFKEHNVYVLGYGSLLFASGWTRRGMISPPGPKELIECKLNGFERGPFGVFNTTVYYGIIRNIRKYCNGVLAPVNTLRDWANLMFSEHIAGLTDYVNYRVVDVTDEVSCVSEELKKPYKIHAVCNRPVNNQKMLHALPAPWYYGYVWDGILAERSEPFAAEFLKTGGFRDQYEVAKFLDKEAGYE